MAQAVVGDYMGALHPLCFAMREGVYAYSQVLVDAGSNALLEERCDDVEQCCDACNGLINDSASHTTLIRYIVPAEQEALIVWMAVRRFTSQDWLGASWYTLYGFCFQEHVLSVLFQHREQQPENRPPWFALGRLNIGIHGEGLYPEVYEL